MIYMDSAAATHPCYAAETEFRRILRECPYNPNSEHSEGEKARQELDKAREIIARCVDCEPSEVHFTSTASESAAWAMKTLYDNCDRVIVNPTDHHCVTEYPTFPDKTGMRYHLGIARMHSNNETGNFLTAPEHQDNTLWFCDATSSIGHTRVSFRRLSCDYMSGDALKFGGIPGAAFLIVKNGVPLSQLIYGSPLRGGTPPVALICAMAKALERRTDALVCDLDYFMSMRGIFVRNLSRVPGARWNTDIKRETLPHILNIAFDGVDGKALAMLCSKRGLMISAGAACTSGDNAPSHVIMAMFDDEERARSSIRISLSTDNTNEECLKAVKIIIKCVDELRAISC